MTLAEQLEALQGKGFSAEQARVIVLIREAATILFRHWPECFILYGGANLVLFHDKRRFTTNVEALLSDRQRSPGHRV